MSLWQSLMQWLQPSETRLDETFSLGDRGDQPGAEERNPQRLADIELRSGSALTHIASLLDAAPKGKEAVKQAGDLSDKLDDNVKWLKQLFHAPTNKDLVVRELTIATQPPTRAVVCFMDGLADKPTLNNNVLQPLMLLAHLDHHVAGEGDSGPTTLSLDAVKQRLLPGNQLTDYYDLEGVAEALLAGDSVLIFDGLKTAVGVETKGFPARQVSEPKQERVVWGAQDAFVEAIRTNIALVRRRLRDPRIITEILTVGELSHTFVAVMYIRSITSPKLVSEVKRRIKAIKVDAVPGTGVLEQYIEDNPRALLPGTLITERPDRTAGYLAEGHVVVLLDNSPQALIAPTTFWSLLQTSEDYHLRWPFGTLTRYLRLGALLIALMVPSIYIAVLNYHQEMLPTELMLFIASTREQVPLPAVFELLAMDLAFELIREAGVRLPSLLGPTMGLVASLILGQAAVQAQLTSPLLIIIVAMAGLASFAVPNYMTSFGIRGMRFIFLMGAATLGLYGVGAVALLLLVYLASMRSFGVPYLSPVAPARGRITDVLNRPPMYQMEWRPSYVRPLNERRQAKVVRTWDPAAPPRAGEDDQGEGGDS